MCMFEPDCFQEGKVEKVNVIVKLLFNRGDHSFTCICNVNLQYAMVKAKYQTFTLNFISYTKMIPM